MTDPIERNKQNATGFYDLMFNQCKPDEAVSKFNIASFSAGIGFLEQNESFRKLGREQIC